jgi:hypothetical protein
MDARSTRRRPCATEGDRLAGTLTSWAMGPEATPPRPVQQPPDSKAPAIHESPSKDVQQSIALADRVSAGADAQEPKCSTNSYPSSLFFPPRARRRTARNRSGRGLRRGAGRANAEA